MQPTVTRKSLRPRARLVILLVSVGVLTSGCFAFDPFPGGASISRQGDYLLVAMCRAINADKAEFQFRDLDESKNWTTFWRFENGGALAVGSVLSLDPNVTPPFAQETRTDVDLKPGIEIVVSIVDNSGERVSPGFTIPASGITEGRWLQSDGSETKNACPAEG